MKKKPPTCKRGHPRTPENTYRYQSGKTECRVCKRDRGAQRYLAVKNTSKRKLLDAHFDPDRKRYLEARDCPFQHPMKIIEPGVWFCDHRICGALLVQLDIPGFYDLHQGTGTLVYSEDECRDYLAGKQTLRELINTRL